MAKQVKGSKPGESVNDSIRKYGEEHKLIKQNNVQIDKKKISKGLSSWIYGAGVKWIMCKEMQEWLIVQMNQKVSGSKS